MLPAFSLIIPAFNEARRIGDTLTEALIFLERTSPESEVIVVDDGSTDATSEIVREVFAARGSISTRLIQRPVNRGKGAAVRAGLCEAARMVGVIFRCRFLDADRRSAEVARADFLPANWMWPLAHAPWIDA